MPKTNKEREHPRAPNKKHAGFIRSVLGLKISDDYKGGMLQDKHMHNDRDGYMLHYGIGPTEGCDWYNIKKNDGSGPFRSAHLSAHKTRKPKNERHSARLLQCAVAFRGRVVNMP